MNPTFFTKQVDFRKWLEKNHAKADELYVGFYKVGSGKESITWPQSVEEALCFGWIDGVRKSIDEESYYIRFTPRKPGSIWSAINIKKIEELSKLGVMTPAGIDAYNKRAENKSKIYSYENAPATLHKDYEKQFKANSKAWKFFQLQPAWYKRTAVHLVMQAKQPATQQKRLEQLIKDSEAGKKIKQLSYGKKK
ncbi:MAG TPA: YdeI/OmpD-associated family protein [Chitinophagaceae bacterium]|nr:YdeI/OmpD-associated family protein [Chitinophagaceae bacterium]